jgi:hypothetical protein
MGAWGTGIRQSDKVLDVIDAFVEQLRDTRSIDLATAGVRSQFSDAFADPDSAAHVRIGLALSQWTFGALDRTLLDEIAADLADGRGIDSYGDDAPARRKSVQRFIAALARPNARPRALPKPARARRRPKPAAFAAGDCLALRAAGGSWRAAIVLVSDVDPNGDGFNVVARFGAAHSAAPDRATFLPLLRPGGTKPALIAMFPRAPYNGDAELTVVATVDVDPNTFGIEKTPGFWTWQFTAGARAARPMSWFGWDQLGARLP